MNGEIRRRIKTVSSFPDEDSAMKIFYLKSIEFNSRHAFRKMNGYYKCHDRLRKCSIGSTLYKYTEYGTRSNNLCSIKP